MVAIYIGHSLQIAHLVGEFFTTYNGQVPHLRLVNCGLAFFFVGKKFTQQSALAYPQFSIFH